MKVLICCLNSKYIHASLAPWCLAAGVKSFGSCDVEFEVFESTVNADIEKVIESIIEKGPLAVSFSCYIWNITKTLEICERLKKEMGCTIVLGGSEVSYRAQDVLEKYEFVDFVLSGEGEQTFPILLQKLEQGRGFDSVAGLSFRRQNGVVSIPEAEYKGTPPSPFSDEFFKALNGRISYIETSRGCPFRCAFCLSGGCSKLRFFDLKQVKSDILKLSQSGTKTVKFVDRTFNANTQRADEILKFIKDNYAKGIPQGVCFHFEIAGDILKESTMELLASMPRGLVQLEIGMQSFNEQTLEAINRKTDTGKLINNIKRLVGFGNMHIHIDLIAGLTGEDILSFERSFNIGYSLKSNMLQMGFLKLLYGADMRESPEKYPCEFMDEPPYEVISTPWLDAREIKMLKKCEDALERLYNSGRFLFTLDYLINEVGFTPFRLFNEFGNTVSGEKMSLKTYTKLIYDYFKPFCDAKLLRDKLVSDLLVSGSVDYIPDELKRYDPLYKKAKGCFKNSEIALLYSTEQVIAVQRNGEKDFFGRYEYKITDFSQCDTVGMEC